MKTAIDRLHPTRTAPSAWEQAILHLDEPFILDYDESDSKALAGLFLDDAEVVKSGGCRYHVRDQVAQGFVYTVAASPGSKIEMESPRFLGTEVSPEEVRSLVFPLKGANDVASSRSPRLIYRGSSEFAIRRGPL